MKPLRIAFYGNFGSGNLGNECTLQSVSEYTRRHFPEARLLCICAVPDDVRVRHEMPAVLSTARESGWSWEAMDVEDATSQLGQSRTGTLPEARGNQGPAGGAVSRGLFGRLLRLFFRRLPVEVVHWVKAFGTIRRIDVLVIPGTQIVSDYLCGPSGWPYDIFKWSVLATVCRAKLVFLSIGVGPIRHPLSAWFIRKSLGRANFRSYRDETSRRCAQSIGVDTSRDEVRPDLAFGLSRRDYSPVGPRGAPHPPVIGLGLKDLSGPSEKVGAIGYREYLDIMAAFVIWLRRNGYAVRLLIGDVQYDTQVGRDFFELLRGRLTEAELAHVLVGPALTVEDLKRQLADTEAVVSPRFHSLLLAVELGKPVIALSDHFKLDQLLAGLGLSQYCVPLEDLHSDRLISRFRQMMSDAEQLTASILSGVERYRTAVEAQYASVFAEVCVGGK